MDPATAFSVAVAALQITEHGINAAKALRKISKYGATASHDRLEKETRFLSNACSAVTAHLADLEPDSAKLSTDQMRLQQVTRRCENLAEDLLDVLNDVHGRQPLNKWNAGARWVRGLMNDSKISKIQTALLRSQELLNTEIMANVWYVSAWSFVYWLLRYRMSLHFAGNLFSCAIVGQQLDVRSRQHAELHKTMTKRRSE